MDSEMRPKQSQRLAKGDRAKVVRDDAGEDSWVGRTVLVLMLMEDGAPYDYYTRFEDTKEQCWFDDYELEKIDGLPDLGK